jgi:hypothetical protein
MRIRSRVAFAKIQQLIKRGEAQLAANLIAKLRDQRRALRKQSRRFVTG